ncbi:flagellar hook-basal body protein [Clostridium sporogenes]|nr:flagellar hook-basal body protein [Clostridium sporogenes]MBZ1327919.1 flagellar basal body rod protein FlgG [Clostridium botulinum]KRU28575.1 flagellar hook-basal body protein [Clostridium sporogenes]KRU35198.1 flagellar hook-basal body protein [Clostridium sporogenes]KRU47561.1 flagellar hook-basal body protein [Clostridium sporogenes]
MLRALWNSKSGLIAQQNKLDSISNNLANVNTVGYKREDVSFQELVQETLKRKGYPTSDRPEIQTGTGVKATNWIRDTYQQGTLLTTGNKTDLAIDGQGFFRVIMADGDYAYERAGNFVIDRNGMLVDENGNALDIQLKQPEGMQILNRIGGFDANNINIAEDGSISVRDTDGLNKVVGKINIYNAVGADAFLSIGRNLYLPRDGVNVFVNNDVSILQGFLENSNVDAGKEMTELIITQRAFELSSRGIKTADEMWGIVNNMRK